MTERSVEILDRSEMVGKMTGRLTLKPAETAIVTVDMHRGHLDPEIATMPAKAEDSARVIAKLNDPALAEALLEDGTADAAAIAKGALADPFWPRKIARGGAPLAFDPAMLRPYATLENVRRWKEDGRAREGGSASDG